MFGSALRMGCGVWQLGVAREGERDFCVVVVGW